MKNKVLVSLLCCFFSLTFSAVAQTVWAPPGAEWWYQMSAVGGPGYVRAWADQTVIWQGQSCRRIQAQWYILQAGTNHYVALGNDTLYTTQIGNEVRVWTGQYFERLFDMSWTLNDRWSLATYQNCSGTNDTALVEIDSLGLIQRGARVLEFRRVKTTLGFTPPLGLNPFGEYAGMVIERLGYPQAVIRPRLLCGTDPEHYQLVYYTDADLTFGTRPSLVTAAGDDITRAVLQVSPNPSNDGRYHVTGVGNVRYDVIDARGSRVCSGQLAGASTEIDLAQQPAGLYVLRLTDAVGRGISRRLVRE